MLLLQVPQEEGVVLLIFVGYATLLFPPDYLGAVQMDDPYLALRAIGRFLFDFDPLLPLLFSASFEILMAVLPPSSLLDSKDLG